MKTKSNSPKKIVVIGATSGIGKELALRYLAEGNIVGITGRREEALSTIKKQYPDRASSRVMDVRSDECMLVLSELIAEMGGMDRIIYCAGIGQQNHNLDISTELDIVSTNVNGFTRIVDYAFNYFKGGTSRGHIVDIASVAGIKALRQSTAYSATKRYQIHYINCLAQKANKEKLPISFTTILPGFIKTDMLKHKYPFVISLDKGARLIYKAIERNMRRTIVPGRWRVVVFVWRLIPNRLWEKLG